MHCRTLSQVKMPALKAHADFAELSMQKAGLDKCYYYQLII